MSTNVHTWFAVHISSGTVKSIHEINVSFPVFSLTSLTTFFYLFFFFYQQIYLVNSCLVTNQQLQHEAQNIEGLSAAFRQLLDASSKPSPKDTNTDSSFALHPKSHDIHTTLYLSTVM